MLVRRVPAPLSPLLTDCAQVNIRDAARNQPNAAMSLSQLPLSCLWTGRQQPTEHREIAAVETVDHLDSPATDLGGPVVCAPPQI